MQFKYICSSGDATSYYEVTDCFPITVEGFIELSELTKKYGIEIGGCGCCGSPCLEERKMVQKMTVAENLKFDEKTKKYSCKVLLKGADNE